MSRTTLKELRALGLEWPPGPVEPPSDENAAIELAALRQECEYFYHDTKGDSRYLEQRRQLESLFATLAITPPMTKRKVEALGLEWPWPFPFDDDEPLDLARAMADLTYGDVMDYTGGRSSYLNEQRARTQKIIDRVAALRATAR